MIHSICSTLDKYLFELSGQRSQSPDSWPNTPLVHPPHGGQEGSFRLQPRTPHALPSSLCCSPCVRPCSLSRTSACLRAFARSVREPFSSSLPRLQLRSILKGAYAPLCSHMSKPSRTLYISCRALATLCHVTSFRDCLSMCPVLMLYILYVTEMCNIAHNTLCIIYTTRTNHGNCHLCRSGVGKLWPRSHTWPTVCF